MRHDGKTSPSNDDLSEVCKGQSKLAGSFVHPIRRDEIVMLSIADAQRAIRYFTREVCGRGNGSRRKGQRRHL